ERGEGGGEREERGGFGGGGGGVGGVGRVGRRRRQAGAAEPRGAGRRDPGDPDRPAPDARAALSPARADRRGGGCLAARERLSWRSRDGAQSPPQLNGGKKARVDWGQARWRSR